ncbi:MAG: NAD(P)H-dependent oxidoreductase subunit E [bacterium]|nr:NAD(P)H-dependent oxidoreductase subunit E [bacterium]
MSHCQCPRQEETLDLAPLDQYIDELKGKAGILILILQRAQELYGWLPRPLLQHIANRTGTPASEVLGVATFYSQFYLEKRGRHIVRQCDGTACHVRGSGGIIEAVETELGIRPGETTPDSKITYEVVYCLGSCGLSPVATVDGRFVGRLGSRDMISVLKDLP